MATSSIVKASAPMGKLNDTRRERLRKLVEQFGGPAALAKRLGYANASFIVQMTGPNPSRDVTERTARAIEDKLRMAAGTLDEPLPAAQRVAPVSQATPLVGADLPFIAEVIRSVGHIAEQEQVQVGPEKLSNLVALVLIDASEHGGVREDQVRRLLDLVK